MARLVLAAAWVLPLVSSGCSLFNAPDDLQPGSGGAGGGSTTTSNHGAGPSAGGGGGTGGHVDPVCMNGTLEGDEECDDGNDENDDACSTDCKITQFDVEVDPSLGNEWPGIGTSGADGGKGFFVVWRWLGPTNEIRGRAYSAAGKRVTDNAVKLSSTATAPGQARIGTNSEGRSIVAWHGDSSENYIVHYRVVGPTGTPEDADKTINLSEMQGFNLATVGASDSGDFAAVWLQPDGAGGLDAMVRTFDPQGSLFNTGPSKLLGPAPLYGYPGVWGVKDGFVASWGTAGGNLGSVKLDTVGNVVDPPGPFDLATDGSDTNPNQNPFGAYVGPDDQFIATYEAAKTIGGLTKNRILKRFFTAPGNSAELGNVVSTAHRNEYQSRVARHSNGRFIVVWTENEAIAETPENFERIKARVFSADGDALGADFQVSKDVKGRQSWPGVAVNSDGDVMFVWDNNSGDEPVPTGSNPYKISSKIYPRLMVK